MLYFLKSIKQGANPIHSRPSIVLMSCKEEIKNFYGGSFKNWNFNHHFVGFFCTFLDLLDLVVLGVYCCVFFWLMRGFREALVIF